MATINLGRVGFVQKGTYSDVTAYKINDVIVYNNGVYACISPTTGNLPTNTSYWKLWVDPSTTSSTYATNVRGGNNTTLLGAIPYQSNVDTTSLLSPNTTTTRKFLRQTGSGVNGNVPVWDTIVASDVPTLNQNTTGSSGSCTGNAGTVTNGVYTTGNQTIDGIKTFSSSPIVPTPTTGTHAVNKNYVNSIIPIGAILSGYTPTDGTIVAFGGIFNRADYPKLWAYLQENSGLLRTEAQWQNENAAQGGICGYYSTGDGTTTFRVPNLDKAFLRPDSRGVASYQVDEFKSHTHTYRIGGAGGPGDSFTAQGWSGGYTNTLATGGNETRPKNIAVLPLIVAK